MESNNHFNYGTHSSANSGLKLSSGDSLYTNGSSMSFPQQGKNMNGEMNVNGVTTVHGSGAPASHPPAAPYPHMSNHHQGSMGYDYLWGGHPQYSPAMGSSPGHGMHQKQPTPGMVQPQPQHHFQGHGQYQLNGGVESPHQPPGAGPSNMPLAGSQYWSRNNPGPQQISYNSHSMYGTYQSQAHPGITPSQHQQQQQQQSLAPPSQQHHSHRHPHHHHQQHQQPQHYGLMPNGMPYYQHQHPSLPSPQQQQQQPPGQPAMMPPAAQNFTPPRGSPQHHSLGRGTGSPLPVGISSTPLMSPAGQDSGSPKGHSRERSPHSSSVGASPVMSGHVRDAVSEGDSSYNGMERAPVPHRLPKSLPHGGADFRQHPERLETTPTKASTPPRISESPTAAPGAPRVSPPDVDSTPPPVSSPPGVSSASTPATPPRVKQGARPPTHAAAETSPAGPKHLSARAPSSSLPASPQRLSSSDGVSRPAAVSSGCPLPSDQASSGPPSAAPMSSLQQMVQGPPPPLMSSCFPNAPGAQRGPPKLMPAVSAPGAKAGVAPPSLTSTPDSSRSVSASNCPSVGGKPLEHQAHTPPAALSTASSASPGPTKPPPLAAHQRLTVRPPPALPLLTTQASRTAAVSAPPALVSASVAAGTSPEHRCPGEDRKRNGTPEERLARLDSTQKADATETEKSDFDPPGKSLQDAVPPDQKLQDRQKDCASEPRKSFHSTRAEHLTREEGTFDTSAHFDGNSTFDSPSRTEKTSLLGGDGSRVDDSTDFDSSFHLRKDSSQCDGASCAEDEASAAFDTTGGSGFSSRDDGVLDSTRDEETSEAEESVLGSSFDSSRPGPEAEWTPRGHDAPDSAGRILFKTSVNEAVTPPSFNMRDENFIAFSTPAESPAVHPLQPVSDPTACGAGGPLKGAGKARKPRTPKTIWIKTPEAADEAQRKPRVRTPKAEKVKAEEEGGDKEEAATGRKRKKAKEANGEAAPSSEEMDSITATIEAVLANAAALITTGEKPKKKRAKKQEQEGGVAPRQDAETTAEDADENDDSSTAGESSRQRRVATEEQVQFPMQHGRMKQFPEIVKYLKRHTDSVVSREHFSFSPRMPIGDFYEERDTPEGKQWVLLANEEVPSMIMAITGRRGRPPNPDKEKPRRVRGLKGGQARRPGRPPKPKMIDLLSKVDAKLLKRLEAKEALTEEEKEKLAKIKKKMKRKARMKRREDAKIKKMKAEKKKAKLEVEAKDQEPKADPAQPAAEPKKPGRRRSLKVEAPPPVQQTDEERIAQGKRVLGARSKAKALAKAQAEAEAAAHAALAAKRAAERRAQAQKRLEERKRQQLIAEELKKPAEDMCLTDHKPLPELCHVPGVVLSGRAFAHCLAVVEFLHGYGKLLGLNIPKDVPSLATLQEGLLGLGDGQGELQDLLMKLVEAALHDPGLPPYYQSVKILGEKLVESALTRSTVSEALRIFLESHGYETEVCNTLRTKPFHALPPDTKASILGFLVDELNGSNIVTSDIDNTLENMATYRKNKWIIEGKLRKLKAALARRTGRSEDELCYEERRRSARVAEEENLSLEEGGLVCERGSRRARKEEAKLSDGESPANASIPELERQIDKLSKRQAFFRKKLLQSSHSMRAVLLGQDRYRRRYLALPHLGGVLVEGAEELLTSADVLVAEVPVTFLKKEPKVEEAPLPTSPPPALPSSPSSAAAQALSPEEDDLPGTASLMSRPRGRGRPRKIKPEVELHLRTAKCRRRRRSSPRSAGEEGPGSPNGGAHDLTQAAFQSWLSHSQEAATNGACSTGGDAPEGSRPEETVKEMAEKQGQWFNLLPKQPCDDNSLTDPQAPSSPPKLLPQVLSALPALAAPLVQQPDLTPADPVTSETQDAAAPPPDTAAPPPDTAAPPPDTAAPPPDPAAPPPDPAAPPPDPAAPPPPQLLPAPVPPATPTPVTPSRPGRRRRRGSRGSSPARRGARAAAAKRRGRPPSAVFQELEQQFFTQLVVKPIPASMVRGWWWIRDPEELYSTLQALHPRGIRERVLHKHLAKHMESLAEMCTKPIADPVFDLKVEAKEVLMEALQQPWQVQEKAMETDIRTLQWVEDLEQRVVGADLHLKAAPQGAINDVESNSETPLAEFQPYTIPDADSTRDDLQYYEHDTDPRDDWIVRTKKEWSGLPRIATHPLDLAVLRLANLERNIERRYLKEPLWNPAEVMRLAPLTPTPGEEHPMDVFSLESEITSRLRTWRQALDRCRSAPQVCLCLLQLEKAIAWERSVTKVTCQVCRKGDNDDCLLLCDSCDRGCHMYCLRPKISQVPEGDWFCPTCVAKEDCDTPRSSKKRTRVKKRRYEDDSSEEETTPRRSSGGGGMATRYKETPATPPSSSSRHSGEGAAAAAKRRRMTTRNQPDLTFCEIILMEMEAHADAWPFLEPVNPRMVPGYRRIVKNPMDFLTMRERLLQGGYCSCEEFAADAQLVFNNCELFNEDTSEVGLAGHAMRRFFESRWAEFYSSKDK